MERQAIDIALDMVGRPLLIRKVQQMALPTGVREVIRLATDSEAELAEAGKVRGRDPKALREAAVLFLQQALFHPGADNHRILGLTPGATAEEIHDHRRLLLKWLHPDRNPSSWEQLLFQRVIAAAAELEKNVGSPVVVTATTASPSPTKPRTRLRGHYHPAPRHRQQNSTRLRAWVRRIVIAVILFTISGGALRLLTGNQTSVGQWPQTAMELLSW
jgi:hypothetical protein